MIPKALQASLLLAIFSTSSIHAPAQNAAADDIGAYSCRNLLLASGDEREGTILVLHAYLLGEAKQTRYDAEVLGAATDRMLDACIDHPEQPALDALRKAKE